MFFLVFLAVEVIISFVCTVKRDLNLCCCCHKSAVVIVINALDASDESVDRHLATLHILELSADDEELALRRFLSRIPHYK